MRQCEARKRCSLVDIGSLTISWHLFGVCGVYEFTGWILSKNQGICLIAGYRLHEDEFQHFRSIIPKADSTV